MGPTQHERHMEQTYRVSHRLLGRQTLHVVISQQPRQEIERLLGNELLIFRVDEAVPAPLREAAQDLHKCISIIQKPPDQK